MNDQTEILDLEFREDSFKTSELFSTWKDKLLWGHNESTEQTTQTSELESIPRNQAPHVDEWGVVERWTAIITSTQGSDSMAKDC